MSRTTIVHRRRGDPIDPSALAEAVEGDETDQASDEPIEWHEGDRDSGGTIVTTDLEEAFDRIDGEGVVVVTSAYGAAELDRQFAPAGTGSIQTVDPRIGTGLSRSTATKVVAAAARAMLAGPQMLPDVGSGAPEPQTAAERVLVVGSAPLASDFAPVVDVTLVIGDRPTRELPGVETHAGRIESLAMDGRSVIATVRTDRGERTIAADQVVWPGYDGDLAGRPEIHDHADAGIVADVVAFARDRRRDPVAVDPGLCAVGTRGVPGCTACRDRCPYDAIEIEIDGEGSVDIDPIDCVDCGGCLSVCPTEAIGSPRAGTLGELEAATTAAIRAATAETGSRIPFFGRDDEPVVVAFVTDTIEPALGRTLAVEDRDLPPVVPIPVSRAQRVPSSLLLATIASGADGVLLLEDPDRSSPTRRPVDAEPVERIAAAANETTAAVGLGERCRGRRTSDPSRIESAIEEIVEAADGTRDPEPADLEAIRCEEFGNGEKAGPLASYELARAAVVSLMDGEADPRKDDRIDRIPVESLGRIEVDPDGCTLCEACDSLCPTGALEQPDATTLTLDAAECIGCGRCLGCPEDVIELDDRVDPGELLAGRQTIVEAAAIECENCGEPFASEASLQAVEEMFGPDSDLDVDELGLRYCPDCRRQHSIGG